MDKYNEAIQILKKYKQDKILEELKKNKNGALIEQILKIDFNQLKNLYNQATCKKEFKNDIIEPIKCTEKVEDEIINIGEDIIRKGKYAVVTMAGGQRNKTRTFRPKRNFKNRCKTKTKISF